ncbi:NAP-domain-containing protein [Macrolepiota fuliginosa MF-IS2]|uniref:NAP-domain-containing protein n=1 Tax=Macrolepiota fuliginosa MF-IS2 TaxID=1400762 RepID=A0A9P6C4M9_9AGAR|nr:NAP-domain-containing protein [Macrolepiota fuliginosa MF-IS2]
MSSNVPISGQGITAPTPQNTPLNQAPIAQGLSRPTVPDIAEDNEQEDGENIAPDLSRTHAHLLGLVQGRLAGLIGKSSNYIESLPLEVKLSIEALKGIQVKQDELQAKLKREITELEKKYLELTKPLYERRNAIISGKEAPTTEEIDAGTEYSLKDDATYTPLSKDTPPSATAIPEFWLTALRNHIGLAELITDRDESALKYLIDIKYEYLNDAPDSEHGGKPGFKLIFTFSSNEFFENETLTKTYLYQQEVGYSGDFIYDRAIGTEIKWKEDKDLTKEFEIKKQRNKNTNRTRLVRKARPTESFFNFFTPPTPLSEEILEDLDEEEADEAEEKLELDYQLGEDFKDKIIPRVVDYFTGKALEMEMMDGDDEYEDIDDEDDEDDEDDDDDDDVRSKRLRFLEGLLKIAPRTRMKNPLADEVLPKGALMQ